MLFSSVEFAIFLSIVFLLYWFVTSKNLKLQNTMMVAASYFFYGWWNWRFVFIIVFITIANFLTGLALLRTVNGTKRRTILWGSILVNLVPLAFFKYYNFFLDSFITAFSFFGVDIRGNSLSIILPIGISFYTFQALGYSLDVYKGKYELTKDYIAFSAFVSFFPLLLAGPIERAKHLLSQFHSKRLFNYDKAIDGLKQIIWGLFKKIVIADSCAEYANQFFNSSNDYSGSTLILGAFFFTIQIYGDFSGYSDIAIGIARLFGMELMRNFAFPYFSRDIGEFWKRWHISLTSWFRDYLYIPLGGSRGGTWMKVRNTFIIFIVSGFWHGANWTFIAWGALNAVYFLPLLLTNRNRANLETVALGKNLPSLKEIFGILLTFSLTVIAWIFFRSDSIGHAMIYFSGIFSRSFFSIPHFQGMTKAIGILLLVIVFVVIEWIGREQQYAIAHLGSNWKRAMRWAMYYGLVFAVFWFGGTEQQFIYFQF